MNSYKFNILSFRWPVPKVLRIGTMCSGTDAPVLVARPVSGGKYCSKVRSRWRVQSTLSHPSEQGFGACAETRRFATGIRSCSLGSKNI